MAKRVSMKPGEAGKTSGSPIAKRLETARRSEVGCLRPFRPIAADTTPNRFPFQQEHAGLLI